MSGTYVNLLYHIIFSTKHREPMILEAFEDELHAYLGECFEMSGEGCCASEERLTMSICLLLFRRRLPFLKSSGDSRGTPQHG